jgi:hypothetical protein
MRGLGVNGARLPFDFKYFSGSFISQTLVMAFSGHDYSKMKKRGRLIFKKNE